MCIGEPVGELAHVARCTRTAPKMVAVAAYWSSCVDAKADDTSVNKLVLLASLGNMSALKMAMAGGLLRRCRCYPWMEALGQLSMYARARPWPEERAGRQVRRVSTRQVAGGRRYRKPDGQWVRVWVGVSSKVCGCLLRARMNPAEWESY
ncbi:hypothetical protein BC827DRAFT_1248976 [Russula dissimulans]|nr:hypothetical protein BC827DRAFT_1248976 [Russula dissimulans]